MDRKLEGLARFVDKRKAGDRASADSMIDLGEVSGVSGTAGEAPSCTVDGDTDADVFEPYGLAGQASGGDALLFAPEGDLDNQVALLSSVAGRPATEPGDKALWSAAGHVVYLDNDGSLKITSKDGAVIEMDVSGAISITAGTGTNVAINVDTGASVTIGDNSAATLLKAMDTQNFLAQAIAFVLLPGNFIPNDGGFKAFQSFLAYITGTLPAPPPGLASAAGTTKAKGT